MARTGPTTNDSSTVKLGLAQIRVLDSATNISDRNVAGVTGDSIGTLASTKYTGDTEFYKLESGFPLMTDAYFPLRESAMLECGIREMTPKNWALIYGLDATSGYTEEHSGEINLGARVTPEFLRMEAHYTYPNGTNKMYIVFPRAQVTSTVEEDSQLEEASSVPVTFTATPADSSITDGDSAWDDVPLGRIYWE